MAFDKDGKVATLVLFTAFRETEQNKKMEACSYATYRKQTMLIRYSGKNRFDVQSK